jgi:NADPH:quinone reductase-like Zn-dependent oxidoreductase
MNKMKAIVCTKFGPPDVLELKEVEKPAPGDKDILIKNHAATVNYGDVVARNFKNIPLREFHMPLPLMFPSKIFFGMRKPRIKILGSVFAGEIETVGKDVKRFKKGDRVYGYLGQNMGAYAQYLCMPEKGVVAIKPADITYEEAVIHPYGVIMAASLLRKVNIQPGQQVLINGASGGIGSAAVQIAKSQYGAEVTGVCGTGRLEFVKSLGADKVIDYTQEDFTTQGETYDLVFDILGKGSFSKVKTCLKPKGRYLLASFKIGKIMQMIWTKLTGGKRVICALAMDGGTEDLVFFKELIEAGKIKSPIDKCFPLEQAAEAHRHVESGQRKGNVVLSVEHNN